MWRVVKNKNSFRLQWNRWIIFKLHYGKEPIWVKGIPRGYYNTNTLLRLLIKGKEEVLKRYRKWRIKPDLSFLDGMIKHLQNFANEYF